MSAQPVPQDAGTAAPVAALAADAPVAHLTPLATATGPGTAHWTGPLGIVRVEPRVRPLRIALAGCGVVGSSLVRLHTAGPLRAVPQRAAAPARDDRALPWIVALRAERDGRPEALKSALARSHLSAVEQRAGRGLLAIRTAPTSWPRLALALAPLRRGPAPVLLRDER